MNKLEEMLPSALIKMALADLERAEASEGYQVDMDNWHAPSEDEICHVCLAGAVIAFSLGGLPTEDIGPDNFRRKHARTEHYLRALDHFRVGNLRVGLMMMEQDPDLVSEPHQHMMVVPYDQNARNFKMDMRAVVARLEGEGL